VIDWQRWRSIGNALIKRGAVFTGLATLIICLLAVLALSGRWAAASCRRDSGQAVPSLLRDLDSGEEQVAFSPSYLELSTGQVTKVDVMVYNVSDLCGFEVHMNFDPSVIQIMDMDAIRDEVNVEPGDFLRADYVPVNSCDNDAGTIDISLVQVGAEPRSGDGCLFSITFMAAKMGEVGFQFDEVLLADDQGASVDVITVLPSFHVSSIGEPTSTPSPTLTETDGPTATMTPTLTPTSNPEGSPTPTPTPHYYLEPQLLKLSPGDTREVDIRTSYVEGLGGVEVHLSWDPNVVEVMDAVPSVEGVQILPGDLFEGQLTFRPPNGNDVDNAVGELVYVLSLSGGSAPVSGEWSVGVVTFHAKGNGSSPIEFHGDTLMANPNTGNIISGWIDGNASVEDPTLTPTQTAMPTSIETVSEPTVPVLTETPTLTRTSEMSYLYIPLVIKN